ncbi:hypothetical protein LINPERHAP1_LOCUS3376 [Linum perenne]
MQHASAISRTSHLPLLRVSPLFSDHLFIISVDSYLLLCIYHIAAYRSEIRRLSQYIVKGFDFGASSSSVMATAPVKPHPLHNFTVSLKWGQTTKLASGNSHRHNRGGGGGSSGSHARPAQPHLSESDAESDREIVSGNLPPSVTNTAVHRSGSRSARQQRSSFSSCSTIFHKPVSEEELRKEVAKKEAGGEDDDEEEEEEEGANQRPWKLRPRRGLSCAGGEQTIQPKEGAQQPQPKSVRLRGIAEGGGDVCGGGGGGVALDKKEKRRFWIALSKEEIEEDIFILTGSRPARRPKKRAKNVQKLLDVNIFPGLWLVGNTVDSYRIAETPMMVRYTYPFFLAQHLYLGR